MKFLTQKLIVFLLVVFMGITLFSCGENTKPPDLSGSQNAYVSTPENIGEESTAENTSEDDPNIPPDIYENIPDILIYNIAVGKKYTAESDSYRTDYFGDSNDEGGNSLRYKLTDGRVAGSGNSEYIAGYGANILTVTIDLEGESLIYGLSADCYGNVWGIGDPAKTVLDFELSSDGQNYFSLGSVSPGLNNAAVFSAEGWTGCVYSVTPPAPQKARFVRVTYRIQGEHVWPSEITVLGFDSSLLDKNNTTPRVYINTVNNDRVHKSVYSSCEITVYDPTGAFPLINDTNGIIKIRGNSTSSGDKAPYNIKFEDKTNVFGMGKAKKWYLIANMYDKTQIRNKLSFDFANDIGMSYVQQSTFVELYLNGVYRGCYQLCESIGVGKSRVDIDVAGNEFLFEYEPWENYSNPEWIRTPIYGILLGFNDPETPTRSQRDFLETFLYKAENAIASRDFEKISEYLDIDSFVDAYIVQEYFKQVDYATSSTRFYIKNNKLYQGPVWDFDLSSGNCSSEYYTSYNNVWGSGNSFEGWQCMGLWNSYLFECGEFKQKVAARYKELQPRIINIYKDNELGKNRIDALLGKFRGDFDKNYTVWSTSKTYSILERVPSDGTYDGEINYLRNWLEERNNWILAEYGIN
ncbi:MAG: CotH kinase family protein [Eubacteriales bacterium]